MNDKETRYLAYQKLREFDSLNSSMMKHIAYGNLNSEEWRNSCSSYRVAFGEWIVYAEALGNSTEAKT